MNKPLDSGKFGKAIRRTEDRRFITGKGNYVDDVDLPGQTHAVFVRTPYPHARITAVDTSAALQMPGVHAVLTGADMKADGLGSIISGWPITSQDGTPNNIGDHPSLAVDRVRYVGEPVAIVIADRKAQARDAAEAVIVDYAELPALASMRAAIADAAVQLHDNAPGNLAFDWRLGDAAAVDAAFARAAHVIELELENNRLVPNAMEPRAINASYNPASEEFTIYLTSQNPHGQRTMLSAVIGLAAENKIRVISPDVGGGFGSKTFNYAEDNAVAWASRKVRRPVKWTADRTESFLGDAHGRDHLTTAQLALDADHRFIGLRVRTLANMGAYVSNFGALIPTYMYAPLLSGTYDIPAITCNTLAVYTNTAPTDAYRGAGRPEASYVIERMVDAAAFDLGVDPAELRRKNIIRQFPHRTPVIMEYESGNYEEILAKALSMSDYAGFSARKAQAAERGLRRGIGLAMYVEACGMGPTEILKQHGGPGGFWESAEVRISPTGTADVLSGAHSHGQGHATVFAQLVADRFGIPMENINVIQGDTGRVQSGVGTFGSRSGALGMSAIAMACDKIIAKAKLIVSHMMQVDAASVNFEAGVFSSTATNQTFSFPEVAGAAHAGHAFPTREIEPGLVATGFYDPPNFTFPAGVYVCELEVDPQTGTVEIISFVASDDFGVIANPMIVEGQVHGGLAQGIGQALWENCHYDPATGQLLTASFMDYGMPRADGLPTFQLAFTHTPSTSNPLGLKGCGEAGAIGSPPAVINAVCNALGLRHVDMPATPEKLWQLCNVAQANARGG